MGTLKHTSLMFLLDLMGKKVIHWIVYDTLDGLRYATKIFLVLVSFESGGKRSLERPITPSEKAVPECILSREETTRRKRLNLLLQCRSIVVTLTEKLKCGPCLQKHFTRIYEREDAGEIPH